MTAVPSGDTLELTLYWQALHTPAVDATIFVHAMNAANTLVSQQDARPWDGQYPTFIWEPGEVVATHHTLVRPADSGRLTLMVGMYTFPGPANLPAWQGNVAIPDGRVRIGDWAP